MEYVLGESVGTPITRRNGLAVRLISNALKSVAFLAKPDPQSGEYKYGATGFFVKHMDDAGGGTYLVTAKHVANEIEGSDFLLRIGDQEVDITAAQWFGHPSGNVDIAVTPFWPAVELGAVRFPTKHFLTEFKIGTKRIGPGDQVQIVGLYQLRVGEKKNLPVVHTGHIAMMPDPEEHITVKNWPGPVEGYLVEAQTLSGLSGSPVFVRRSIRVAPTEETGTAPLAYGAVFLLGLWMASFEGLPGKVLSEEIAKSTGPGDDTRIRVPVGMGVVVPAYKIMETLNTEELRQMRKEAQAAGREELAPSLDTALPTKADTRSHRSP